MMWHGYYMVGGGLWRLIFGVVFFGGFVALIVWAIHRIAGRGGAEVHKEHKEPMDYLKERYAKGEISKEEYEQIRRDLLS